MLPRAAAPSCSRFAAVGGEIFVGLIGDAPLPASLSASEPIEKRTSPLFRRARPAVPLAVRLGGNGDSSERPESPPPAARRRALFASIFSIARSGDIGPAPFVLSIDDERPRIIERGGDR